MPSLSCASGSASRRRASRAAAVPAKRSRRVGRCMPRIIAGYNRGVAEEQVREVIERMNRAWLEGTLEDLPAALGECFHPAMVIRGGDLQVHGAGREACIESYLDFLEQAEI